MTTLVKRQVSPHSVGESQFQFSCVEFTIPPELRNQIEAEITALTPNLDLYAIWDDHKFVKLSDAELESYKCEKAHLRGLHGISKHFGEYYRFATASDVREQLKNCKQVTQHVPVVPQSVVELITRLIPEVVQSLATYSDDPYTYLLVTNAPISYPFGQNDDHRFQSSLFSCDRHPVAEVFISSLLRASGHTIDAPFPGRAFAHVTPDLSKVNNNDNRVYEEESSSQEFMIHIDGANYDEYSSQVCLAVGTDDSQSATVYLHLEAALRDLAEYDAKRGKFSNEMGRQEVLELDIFNHGPGANSTCMNVVSAPVLFRDLDGCTRPRINMTDGRTDVREQELPKFKLSMEDVQESLYCLQQAFNNPQNQHIVRLKKGQVIFFSGEVPHGRTAFAVNNQEPRYVLRLRGTSKKHCELITQRQQLFGGAPRYPGM